MRSQSVQAAVGKRSEPKRSKKHLANAFAVLVLENHSSQIAPCAHADEQTSHLDAYLRSFMCEILLLSLRPPAPCTRPSKRSPADAQTDFKNLIRHSPAAQMDGKRRTWILPTTCISRFVSVHVQARTGATRAQTEFPSCSSWSLLPLIVDPLHSLSLCGVLPRVHLALLVDRMGFFL